MSVVDLPRKAPQTARQRDPMPWTIRLCLGWLAAMILIALLADVLAPQHYATQDLTARFQPPLGWGGSWEYPLGTDNLGRDMLSRLIYALRTSILIAIVGTLIGAVCGTLIGLAAGRLRGFFDLVAMMLTDVQTALPSLFIAITFLAFFGNSIVLFIILVSLEGWERYARLARGLVLSEQNSDYIRAVEGLGASSGRVVFRHLLPNIMAALVVQATLNFPGTILLETSLSFLGLGIQPPNASLGLMLGEGRRYLLNAWWIAVLPGLVIFLTTLAMSLFGDWLRDRLDPTLGRR
jgi:peptide/nickel transport system permease protein